MSKPSAKRTQPPRPAENENLLHETVFHGYSQAQVEELLSVHFNLLRNLMSDMVTKFELTNCVSWLCQLVAEHRDDSTCAACVNALGNVFRLLCYVSTNL